MPNWQSNYVSRLGWDIKTHPEPGAGTDSPVTVTILRDDAPILALNVEPGETTRLDRGSSAFYYWKFTGAIFEPGGIHSWIAGLGYPDGIEFSNDIHGHLKCRFQILGRDLWKKDNIGAHVKYARPKHVEGTIDSFKWVEDLNWTKVGDFVQDVKMSTEFGEGFPVWTLIY